MLGAGRILRRFLPGADRTAAIDVVAIASRDAERASAVAAMHGIPTTHASYENLLADTAIDAVYIAVPNSLHHAWTMRALAAGKHVLCEKPYSTNAAEVDEAH